MESEEDLANTKNKKHTYHSSEEEQVSLKGKNDDIYSKINPNTINDSIGSLRHSTAKLMTVLR